MRCAGSIRVARLHTRHGRPVTFARWAGDAGANARRLSGVVRFSGVRRPSGRPRRSGLPRRSLVRLMTPARAPHARPGLQASRQAGTAATEDAVNAVLSSLDAFRRPTPFETWACKFALVEAAAGVRRHEWQQRAVSSNSDGWAESVEALTGPESSSADADLLRAIVRCMRDDLTADQRRVLIALAIENVPIDVLAERLDTTRGALHRTLRHARRRVRGVVDDQAR